MQISSAPGVLLAGLLVALLTVSSGCAAKKADEATSAEAGAAAEAGTAAPGAEAPAAGAKKPAASKPAAEAPKPAADVPKETQEVVLWHAYRAREKEALEAVVAAYNANQKEVRIRIQAVPYDPFVDKITLTIPRGQGPDLFIFAHNMIGSWVEDGLLEPLGTRVSSASLAPFHPQAVKALVYQGNLYGLPLAFKSLALFYNKRLMPEPPASMEALIEATKAAQDHSTGIHGFVYEAGLLYSHASWIHAFGGSVFAEDGSPAFDTDAQRGALGFARSLHTEHNVLPKGMTSFMVTSLFNDNKAVAVLNGPWFRAEIAEGIDYGVALIPSVAGKPSRPFLGIESVFISKRSERKDAAIKAALYLVGAESAARRMEVGKQPVAHKATLEAGAKTDPVLDTFMKQADQAVIMPRRPEMQLVWSTADMAIAGTIFGDKRADAALKKAQAKITEDISKRGQ